MTALLASDERILTGPIRSSGRIFSSFVPRTQVHMADRLPIVAYFPIPSTWIYPVDQTFI